jgi:hypothetical protein
MKTNKISENDFIFKRVIPLLRKLGFQDVRYVHGVDEYGRDIIFYDKDRFGIQRLYAAQAKIGDISGSTRSVINGVISQTNDALEMPYYDPFRGEEKFVSGYYLIISGKYTRNAKEKIRVKCKGKPVYFLEEKDIDNIALQSDKLEPDIENLELKRLKREALAATRCKSPDMNLFELKLNEIDLLENHPTEDKIKTFSKIGLEVTLNSDAGIDLLVKHVLWQLAGWENKSMIKSIYGIEAGRRLLETLAATLWDWGFQAVEYLRSEESVKTILDAILIISEKSKLIGASHALTVCWGAAKAMYDTAVAAEREDVLSLIDGARKKLGSLPT